MPNTSTPIETLFEPYFLGSEAVAITYLWGTQVAIIILMERAYLIVSQENLVLNLKQTKLHRHPAP